MSARVRRSVPGVGTRGEKTRCSFRGKWIRLNLHASSTTDFFAFQLENAIKP
jgi:hypothetical protein